MPKIKKTRYALLGILSMGSFSGYDMKKIMQQSTDHFWREGDSSIYPILKQLLKEELVICDEANTDSGRPKKVYTMTAQGHQALQEWLRNYPDSEYVRNELLLKLFFGWNVEREVIVEHIKQYRRMEQQRCKQYQQWHIDMPALSAMDKQQFHQYLTIRAGIAYAQASLDWCDEAIQALEGDNN